MLTQRRLERLVTVPRNARPRTMKPIALRELEVLRVTDVTPGMRRVTLTGEQLGPCRTPEGVEQQAFVSTGFDDDVRLFFCYPGENEPVLPTIKATGGLSFPRDREILARAYTVRRFDTEAGEVDVDFVTHGIGVASTWAHRATPGQRLHVAGPSVCAGLPEGADWLLVVGDDTALPAIARLLEMLPEDARAQVFIEIGERSHRQELRELPGVEVTWIERDGAEPGDQTLLLDAVRAAEWWPGQVFAWLAGEQSAVRDLRRHLVEEREVAKTDIDFSGCWKREKVEATADDDSVPDPEHEAAFMRFHEQAEIAPALAIRAAADLGIGDLVSRGVRTVPALAERIGADPTALGKLLRYLRAIDLVTCESAIGDDVYRLTETGEFLTNDYVLDVLRSDGVEARQQLALQGLTESVRTGGASYASVTGHDAAALWEDESYARAVFNDASESGGMIGPSLAELPEFADARRVTIHSDGAGAVAAALVAAHPQMQVEIVASPAQAAWLRDDLPMTLPEADQRERVIVITAPSTAQGAAEAEADVVVTTHTLARPPRRRGCPGAGRDGREPRPAGAGAAHRRHLRRGRARRRS